MQADNIETIVNKLEKLPYKCILFDGTWGIGKSYAVDRALKKNDNVCKISVFGLQESQQIYHEALYQLAMKNSIAGKVSKQISDMLEGISAISEKFEKVKNAVNGLVKEKELFFLLSQGFDSLNIIVIDDLERIGDNVNLQEVLGIVEELKKCNYVKVILVANSKEMTENDNRLLARYSEKVIDRIYYITDRPENINWKDMGIKEDFMRDFLAQHKVKNLRTLQKAQNFYDDVRLYCESFEDEEFLKEVRLICFAIVVESTDNLYYKEEDNSTADNNQKVFRVIHNELEYRIMYYLPGIKSGKGIVTLLLKYYKNEACLDVDIVRADYELFLKAGRKPNYYKTDEEIRQLLVGWKEKIEITENTVELNRFADEYVTYGDILGEDISAILKEYENKLHVMLWKMASNGKENVLSLSYNLFNLSSDKIKKIYADKCDEIRKLLIDLYIEYLTETTTDRKAFEYS